MGVQRSAAALIRGHLDTVEGGHRRPADGGVEDPFEAAEQEPVGVRPGRRRGGGRRPPQDTCDPDEPRPGGEREQRPDPKRAAPAGPLRVAQPLQQPAVGDVGGAHGLARPAAEAERALLAGGGVEDVDLSAVDGPHQRDPAAG
ncbi:hypothetical protein [Dactylosporangium cerinum]